MAQISEWNGRDGMSKETLFLKDAFEDEVDRAAAVVEALAAEDEIKAFPDEITISSAESIMGKFVDYLKGNHDKSAIKRENGMDFPPRDYAFVPDPTLPSTWKLRLAETPGKITITQLGRAAAALSSGGFRGERVQIPPAAASAIKRRIRAEYRRLGVREEQIPAQLKETSFNIWKQANGQYRWLAVYSNAFRDDDLVPEIIAKESHELFVEMVDKGIVDYPELWHFHVPGTRWGKADWVGFSDGFALASGTVDAGHEKEAELLSVRDDIGVSHGMPSRYILRDGDDPTVIITHVTTEISPLPMQSAANKLTGFFIKESEEMALSEQKKQHLMAVGFSEDQLASLESGLKEMADNATSSGIESKEAGETTETDATATDTPEVMEPEAVQEAVAEAVQEAVADEKEVDAAVMEEVLTRAEVGDALKSVLEIFTERLNAVSEKMQAVAEEVKSLRDEDQARLAKAASVTPSMSLAEMIGQQFSKEAELDGRASLAKSKPQEKKEESVEVTGVPHIDSLFQ